MIPTEPGLYDDIRFEDYVKIDAVNNSVLKILSDNRKCPAHALEYIDNGRPDTPALAFGRAMDAYILEPGRFLELYAVMPNCDRRTKSGKLAYAEFEAALRPGQELITQEDYEKCQTICNAVTGSVAMELIRGGKSQVVAVWIDKETGLKCKARYDYYRGDIPMITDLKSTRDASPDGFGYDIFKYGYYQQAGFYVMGHETLTGDEPCFAIFAIEKEPPYVHSSYQIGDKTLLAGRNAARAALTKYKQCMDSGQWPLFNDKIVMLDMPKFALDMHGANQYQM